MVAVRTALIDQLVTAAIARDRIDTVVNLACGFDTRPFRLELPAHLRWFDIDGPPIIARKCEVLGRAAPRCRWHPLVADLAAGKARREALRTAMDGAQRALVLTEGLLPYLHADQVSALATDLAFNPACTVWITDLLSADSQPRVAQIYRKPFAASGIRSASVQRTARLFSPRSGSQKSRRRSIGGTARRTSPTSCTMTR